MVHSESRKCKKCQKLCNPNTRLPLFTATRCRRAELITIFSCIITTWAFSELAELLMICSSCQFSNHFTLSPCFKIYASTFVRDLCTLGTKPRFPKKGVYCPRQRFPQKQFWWHNLDRKKKKSSVLLFAQVNLVTLCIT